MTIIAAHKRQMGADSWSFCNGVGYPAPQSKIVRAPDGSLVGSAGASVDCATLRGWVKEGMNFGDLPPICYPEKGEGISWLWLRTDGRLFYGNALFIMHEISLPAAVGVAEACIFAEGMLEAGATLKRALTQAIYRCDNVGGEPLIMSLPR